MLEGPMNTDELGFVRSALAQAADDVWIVNDTAIQAAGLQQPVRMTITRLSNGALLLHSAVRYSSFVRTELERIGPINTCSPRTSLIGCFFPSGRGLCRRQ